MRVYVLYTLRPCRHLIIDVIRMRIADVVMCHRPGKEEGKDAEAFLGYVTEKVIVAMGMISDGAHEGLLFTRFADDQNMDASEAPYMCAQFVHRLQVLFVEGQCTKLPGFTQWVIDGLKRPRTLFFGGRPKVLGGPGKVDVGMINELLQRMVCWTKLARDVITTEWPCFDVLNAFVVFRLSKKDEPVRVDPAEHAYVLVDGDCAFKKLAFFFEVDEGELRSQHADFLPLAQRMFATTAVCVIDAWRQALDAMSKRSSLRESHPAQALTTVFKRYAVYSGTTAGVERINSLAERVLRFKSNASASYQDIFVKLIADRVYHDQKKVVDKARELWHENYGSCRDREGEVLTSKGIKRKTSDFSRRHGCSNKLTEAGFLRRRNRSIADAVTKHSAHEQQGCNAKLRDAADSEVWSARHQKEATHQAQEFKRRKVEANLQGSLMNDEMSAELLAATETFKKGAEARAKARDKENDKIEATRKSNVFDLKKHDGKAIAFLKDTACKDLRHRAHMAGLTVVTEAERADIYVVELVGDPGKRCLMKAGIFGAFIVSPQTLKGQPGGSYAKYKPGGDIDKRIWASPDFQHKHGELFAIIRQACTDGGTKWRMIVGCKATFVREWVKANKSHRGPNTIALVCSNEAKELESAPSCEQCAHVCACVCVCVCLCVYVYVCV